jgi:hypothetical protein
VNPEDRRSNTFKPAVAQQAPHLPHSHKFWAEYQRHSLHQAAEIETMTRAANVNEVYLVAGARWLLQESIPPLPHLDTGMHTRVLAVTNILPRVLLGLLDIPIINTMKDITTRMPVDLRLAHRLHPHIGLNKIHQLSTVMRL